MQSVIDDFDERKQEIEEYYSALEELYVSKNITNNDEKYLDDAFLKMLKSNAILMIYNLIRYMIKMHTLTRIEERQKKSLILF